MTGTSLRTDIYRFAFALVSFFTIVAVKVALIS